MNHNVLGEIQFEDDTGDALALVSYGDRDIKFRIVLDSEPAEACLDFAASTIPRLKELDEKAKKSPQKNCAKHIMEAGIIMMRSRRMEHLRKLDFPNSQKHNL